MLRVGLTGGIGCGKTTVCDLFVKKGIPVVDADAIAHSVVEPGSLAYAGIVNQFGSEIVGPDGHLNRKLLGRIVFSDPYQKKKLENIIHPLVFKEITSQISTLSAPYCILSIPLLIESGQFDVADRVLVVDCPVDLQVSRVKARDTLNESQIRRIIKSQASRQEKLDVADDVIVNNADRAKLRQQVEQLHQFYLALQTQNDRNG